MEMLKCLNENKDYPVTSFFKANERSLYGTYGHIPFCKKCIGKIATGFYNSYGNKKVAIFLTCMKLDVRFFSATYENVFKDNISVDRLMFAYIEEQLKVPFSEGGNFDDAGYSMGVYELLKSYVDSGMESAEDIEASWVSYIVTKDDLDFWGGGYTQEGYYFLSNTMKGYIESFGHATSSASTLELLKQICYTTWEIKQARDMQPSNADDIDKLTKRLSTLLADAHMKPSQKKESSGNADTFGEMIRRIENDDPIPDPLPEWTREDVFDDLGQWIVGHLAKMMDKTAEDTENYEKEMEKYTVTLEDE